MFGADAAKQIDRTVAGFQPLRGLLPAQRFGLGVADKPDSQDICFVPNGSYASVIERLRPSAW